VRAEARLSSSDLSGSDLKQMKASVVTTTYVRPHQCVYELKDALPSCQGTPFYQEHGGERFCIFHYPGKEKSREFSEAFKKKLEAKSYNFKGFWFPDKVKFLFSHFQGGVDFNYATFSDEADFSGITFTHRADFNYTTFSKRADFNYAMFDSWVLFGSAKFLAEAFFMEARFKDRANFHTAIFTKDAMFNGTFEAEVFFNGAEFKNRAEFGRAKFNDIAEFGGAKFSGGASFGSASFGGRVSFAGRAGNFEVFESNSRVDFQHATIEKPDRVSFHSLTLRPHWLVNVDPRKFDFTNVDWNFKEIALEKEIAALERNRVSSPYDLLSIAFRRLAVNAEENHRYEEASRFRYLSMDARRPEKWHAFAI
jgi:hypothetical protein